MLPFLFIFVLLFAAVVLVLIRTFTFKSPKVRADAEPYNPGSVSTEVLRRLSKALAIPTVCMQDYEHTNFIPFDAFITYLQEQYPLFHKTCECIRINTYALVYRWKGKDPALLPMMLTAHYDVVPVESGTEESWKYPPFSGAVAEGRIWGRGALDIKSQLLAHLEAAEALMQKGFIPQRDFYFVYGQDEEIGGCEGAQKVADYFIKKGIRLDGILDEGGFAVSDAIKGSAIPLGLIGIAEKGFCNYELIVEGEGGHSSIPPSHTALGNAAKLICDIESNPLPARLTMPTTLMLRSIGSEMGFALRIAIANLWLFRPILLKFLAEDSTTNAMIRTTFAATMSHASSAANVLPQKSQITINVRLLSGDSTDSVAAYFKKLAEGIPFTMHKLTPVEPSKISPINRLVFLHLKKIIHEVYPNIITTPYLVIGGTDSRKYYQLCDSIYRFTPILISNEEKNSIHGANESISIANYGRMIYFFIRFIEDFEENRPTTIHR